LDFGSSVPQTPAAADRHSGVGDDDLVVGSKVLLHLSGGDQGAVNSLAQRREIDAVLVTELSRWGAAYSTSCTR
jgi:hypothetical protein